MDWIRPVIWLLCGWGVSMRVLDSSQPVMHGEVQSPGYPQPYPNKVIKQWDLSVPEGYQLQLQFIHLDIETSKDCFYDSLTILNNDKVLGVFCGQEKSSDSNHPGNKPILSPGNSLSLVFRSDDTNPESSHVGFFAYYQAIDMDECSVPNPEDGRGPPCSQLCHNTLGSYICSCRHGYLLRPDQRTCVLDCGGGIFTEHQGTLTSPGYPNPSPLGMSCEYLISVDPGFLVTLNFTGSFHIEEVEDQQGSNCLFHWLQVTIPGKEPWKLCGTESPGVIRTEANSVQLLFRTDGFGLSQGWSLRYSTERVQCETPRSVVHGRATPVLPRYLYRDYVHVHCETGYKLMMDGMEIQSYSSTCQSNGKWHIHLPECHIIDCGSPSSLLNGGVSFVSGAQNQFRSVIQYHCNEPYYTFPGGQNVSYTCEADREWKDSQNNYVIPPCNSVCGKPAVLVESFQRILGGNIAPPGAFPWQVLLNAKGNRGGAFVIGDRWILTAAHNVFNAPKEMVKVYLGGNDANILSKFPPFGLLSIHVHPNYNNPDGLQYNNDIALIKLQQPLTFNASIMPLCLPGTGAKYEDGKIGQVSGFGVTEERKVANELRYLGLPLVNQEVCRRSIAAATKEKKMTLTDSMFCAGLPEGKKDSCQGDSGGAYILSDGDRYWAAGIVSWGIGCGKHGNYGVYTRVANYLDWITMTMENN